MKPAKPFDTSKQLVWEAYQEVKANGGAAGVDQESIERFEARLKDNLYRLWNRMSSGSYFPPPFKAVEIPKKVGGTRVLGVPTVSDRIAQTVVKKVLEPVLESNGVRVSMDGRCRVRDNIFIERLWWTIKHHYLYLHAFDNGSQLRTGLKQWFAFYNSQRSHRALDNMTPDEVYYGLPSPFARFA